ncbi:MAG: acyl carrier protein [Bacillota bacterium]
MVVMDISEVKEKVIEAVSRNALFNADKVNENSRIRRDHGIDSIRLVELVVDLEEEFDIEVDSASLTYENFATIELITNYIMNKIS